MINNGEQQQYNEVEEGREKRQHSESLAFHDIRRVIDGTKAFFEYFSSYRCLDILVFDACTQHPHYISTHSSHKYAKIDRE